MTFVLPAPEDRTCGVIPNARALSSERRDLARTTSNRLPTVMPMPQA